MIADTAEHVADHALSFVVGAPSGTVSVRVIAHAAITVAARLQLRASARLVIENTDEGTER